MSGFTTITWNMGGVQFLRTPQEKRESYKEQLNTELKQLIHTYSPDLILMQEIVRYEESGKRQELISPPEGYAFQSSIAINSIHQNHPLKWADIRKKGGWSSSAYLGQGNGILWRKSLNHSSIWDIDHTNRNNSNKIIEEKVRIDTGLFTGFRDTEPRISVVYHFIHEGRDIFVVNMHLTTLRGEREGLPAIDLRGSKIRRNQIRTVMEGVVSRYNEWRKLQGESNSENPPLWILAGDFNATPNSIEIKEMETMSFIDVAPVKGLGTKRKKTNFTPSITVDYIFAGPTYHAFDPHVLAHSMLKIEPDYRFTSSDHFPVISSLEI